jgi:hypothetical protein
MISCLSFGRNPVCFGQRRKYSFRAAYATTRCALMTEPQVLQPPLGFAIPIPSPMTIRFKVGYTSTGVLVRKVFAENSLIRLGSGASAKSNDRGRVALSARMNERCGVLQDFGVEPIGTWSFVRIFRRPWK